MGCIGVVGPCFGQRFAAVDGNGIFLWPGKVPVIMCRPGAENRRVVETWRGADYWCTKTSYGPEDPIVFLVCSLLAWRNVNGTSLLWMTVLRLTLMGDRMTHRPHNMATHCQPSKTPKIQGEWLDHWNGMMHPGFYIHAIKGGFGRDKGWRSQNGLWGVLDNGLTPPVLPIRSIPQHLAA